MDAIIEKIVEIISPYRNDDWFVKIDQVHVKKWIKQFNEEDREFILTELLHLLPQSFLTKEKIIEILGSVFDVLKKDFKYESIEELLDHTCFLHCQDTHKSQSILLKFLDEILVEKYGRSINDCGSKEIKFWLYLDDVLASGGTCRRDIVNVIEEYGKEVFEKSEIIIICIYFILHDWGSSNCRFAIRKSLGYELNQDRLKFYRIGTIENNPRIHNYWNPSPKFNHTYPLESDEGKEFLEFIDNAFKRDYDMKNEEFAFRDPAYPKKEEFFSSPENRNRYEQIILKKGIEIINRIGNLNARGLRPLGMTPPAYKTLGTGSHIFTWRNISNTCPIVYWWEANDWYPLFPVKNRGN